MIDVAFVSGQIGKALYRDGEQYYSLIHGSFPMPIRHGEFREILDGQWEFELLEKTDIELVRERLEMGVRQHRCLFLMLTLLDDAISLSARVMAAQAVDALLEDATIIGFLRRRMLSIPLPVQYRSRRHECLSSLATFPTIKNFLHELFDYQATLDQLWAEWREVLSTREINPAAQTEFEGQLVEMGFFENLAQALNQKNLQGLNARIVQEATNPIHGDSSLRGIFVDLRGKLHQKFFARQEKRTQTKLKLLYSGDKTTPTVESKSSDFISNLIERSYHIEPTERELSALERKNRVDKQISAIRELLHTGKDALAEKYLEELLEFQLGQGDREHAAMSLCSLAAISIDANQLDMADRLSTYAIKLNVYDPVVYTVRAEVLKNRGHFAAALKAYEEAKERFPNGHYAYDGYADVLNELGAFDESIKHYKEAQKRFPDDPVAFNGEVSVLRNRGNLRSAVKLALQNTKKFPQDSVTRGSLASCLSAIGKYDEAIRHYKLALSLAPGSTRIIISYCYTLKAAGNLEAGLGYLDGQISKYPLVAALPNTKAKLFQAAGKFDEALEMYKNILEKFPAYTPAKFGRSAVTILLGRIDEALKSLPEHGMESELDWFGFRAYALAFARVQNYDLAAQKLQFGIETCPWIRERTKLETALGFVELARNNLAQSIRLLQNNIDKLEQRHRQTRLLLLGHSQALRGEFSLSKILLTSIFSSRDPQLCDLQREIQQKYESVPGTHSNVPVDSEILFKSELNLALAA